MVGSHGHLTLTKYINMITDELRDKICEEAETWVGTPYRHQFMNKGIGASCILFIVGVYSNLGLVKKEIPPYYHEDWAFNKTDQRMPLYFENFVAENLIEIDNKDVKPGDIITYNFGKKIALSHAAIMVKQDMVIHAEKPVGVHTTNRQNKKWYDRERVCFTYGR